MPRAELPKWRCGVPGTPAFFPRLGAHTPFNDSPQYRSCIASNSGQGRVSQPRRRMLELSCGGSGGTSVGRRKIAKKIAKNKRCYANTLLPPLKDAVERR